MTEQLRKTLRDSAAMRWTVMVMISVLMFATYWFQDFFSGLKPLMESQLGISSSEFGALIGLTTIANVFGMIIVGGMFLDRFGIRWTAIVFGSVVTFGAALTAVGALGLLGEDPDTRLNVMIAGRVFFGTGLEVTCVLVTRTMVKWFKGHELALAMALNVAFGRGGSAIGTMFSIDIGGGQVPAAVTFAATLVGVGFIMFLAYLIFDVKLDKQLAEQGEEEEEPFRFSDLFKLLTDKSFIYITLLCVAFYSAVFPFMQYAPDLLINKFGFSLALPDMTGWSLMDKVGAWLTNGPKVAGLLPLGTILLTPIFGSIMDKKGKAASLMMLGSVLLIFAHLALSVFNNVYMGYAGLLCLGAAFSLVPAAMWPSVAKIVAENRLGTAYATMFTIQNWGLLLFFWGIGKVVDLVNPEVLAKIESTRTALEAQGIEDTAIAAAIDAMRVVGEIPPYDYTIPILCLVGLGVISIFLAYMLKRADHEQGYGLEDLSRGK
ncbi:MAG: MFS transporter [Pseudomonadota bacterium]